MLYYIEHKMKRKLNRRYIFISLAAAVTHRVV